MNRATSELAATAAKTRALAGDYPTKEAIEHDEVMRMQALAIGASMLAAHPDEPSKAEFVTMMAKWAYREATGREWAA